MEQKVMASTLGIFVFIASGAWIPSEVVHAVMFSPPPNSEAPSKATGGASRGSLFAPKSGESAPSKATGGASRGNLFAPKSGESAPQRTAGGASREGRSYLNLADITTKQPAAILALLPKTYFGTTVSQRPDILVYLPASQAREGVFSLKDAQGNTLHEMNVPVSGLAGVISIKVPTNLQVEKTYQWFLALKIDGELSPRTPYVDGWIKRIQPKRELANLILEKDLLKQAAAFGKHGVWYDCAATLAKLRNAQPSNQNLNKHWSELLASVGLAEIDKAPVLADSKISQISRSN